MADDIAITAGSGTTVATDDVGGRHVQLIGIIPGPADTAISSRIGGDATNGLDVDVTRVSGNVAVSGDVAHDAGDSGSPQKVGGVARTTNPTAVADGDRVNASFDTAGRQLVSFKPRDLMAQNTVTFVNTSGESTLLAAGAAGVFHDLTGLVITNASATAIYCLIRDASGGTVRMNIAIAANGGAAIFPTRPITQTTAANPWTAQLSVNTVTVSFFIQAEKNV